VNATNQALWALYCVQRDKLVAQHHDCLRRGVKTPCGVWRFVIGREPMRQFKMPAYSQPGRLTTWLRRAISHCENVIEHPNELTRRPESHTITQKSG